jgi:hypothetical protein
MGSANLTLVRTNQLTAVQLSGLEWARQNLERAFAVVTAAHHLISDSEHADEFATVLHLLEIAEDTIGDYKWMARVNGAETLEAANV